MHSIEETARKAGELMDGVAARAKEQTAVLSEMADGLAQVEKIARRNADAANGNAGSAGQLLRMANHMRKMLDFGLEVKEGAEEFVELPASPPRKFENWHYSRRLPRLRANLQL